MMHNNVERSIKVNMFGTLWNLMDSLRRTYIPFLFLDSLFSQQAPGVRLQQNHCVPLAFPFLPGQVASDVALQQEGSLTLLLVLKVELPRANVRLKPRKAQLNLKSESLKGWPGLPRLKKVNVDHLKSDSPLCKAFCLYILSSFSE